VSKEELCGRLPSKALMRAIERVVMKPLFDSPIQLVEHERREEAERKVLLKRFPEAFNDGDGAGLPDGAEAMSDAMSFHEVSKDFSRELRALVRDEVLRSPKRWIACSRSSIIREAEGSK